MYVASYRYEVSRGVIYARFMRSRNTRFQPSWLCRLAVGGLRSSHILEDQVLKRESATDFIFSETNVLTVEASMRARQSVLIAVIPVDVESTKAIHTLKLAKAVKRHFAGTSNEL